MANEYVNKVVVGTETKLDLTADTITAADLKKGATAHDKSGTPIVGTNENDVNSADATAAVAEVLTDKTFYARGSRLTGTMPNIGKQTGSISVKAGTVSISQGYHDGSGSIGIAAAEQTKMIPANIKQGVTILGVEGSYGGETVKAQANKNVTPGFAQQVVTPDEGFDYLAQVTVAAIPVTYIDNAAGGQTMTVGA